MTVDIYYSTLSSPSLAVRVFVEVAGIPHKLHSISLGAEENRGSDYLKLNPLGIVPYMKVRNRGPEVLRHAIGGAVAELPAFSAWTTRPCFTCCAGRRFRPGRIRGHHDVSGGDQDPRRRPLVPQYVGLQGAAEPI